MELVMRIMGGLTMGAGLAVAALGCGGDLDRVSAADPTTWSVVRNPAPVEAEVVSLEPAIEIGGATAAGAAAFGQVNALSGDDAGGVWVADQHALQVVRFDGEGAFMDRLGGQGEGPGEFARIDAVVQGPGGDVWVSDPRQRRFTVFTSEGDAQRTVPAPWLTMAPRPHIRADTTMFVVAPRMRRTEVAGDPVALRTDSLTLTPLVLKPAGEVLDSFPPMIAPVRGYGGWRIPFDPGEVWAQEPDGSLLMADGSAYRVVRRELTGDTVLVFSLDHEPIPVGSAEVDSIARFRDRISDDGERLDPAWVPEHRPAIAALLPLEEGWVAVFPELPEETGRIVDLFDPGGRHHRRVDLGRALALRRQSLDYRGGRLYGVVRDEWDVQSVVGFDLELPR